MNRAESFLLKHGMHESCYDFDWHVKDFTREMEAGLSGRDSSLLMLPSYLGVSPASAPEGDAIAVDAGGTNLRIALVRFGQGAGPTVTRHEKYRLPGSDGAIGKDEFFDAIAGYIGDMAEAADRAGFCFSFPSEIGADRDGKILGFNKEVKVHGSAGAYIGAELNAAFARMGKPAIKVTVLNDTAAALIGTVFAHGVHGMNGYIGLIYGTGVNICYYDREMGMLINTETGGYGGFSQSACDLEIDRESDNPGDHRFEKMVSGAYFATVALKAARLAAREGAFSPQANDAVGALARLDAVSIDRFMQEGGGAGTELGRLCFSEGDAQFLYGLFDGIYERAAKLVAIAMTAVLGRCGASASRPAFIACEGSAFQKGFRFRERFEGHIAVHAEGGRQYELAAADGQAIIGAAASVFL